MSKSKTVQVTPEEVAEALKQRIPVKDIAALHGCSEKTISRKAAVAGLADEARRISFLYGNNPQLREVKAAFHKKISPEELSDALNISKQSAAHQLQVAIDLFKLQWQGTCEQCGNEFTEFFAMGRFCSKFCARSFSTNNNAIEQSRRKKIGKATKDHWDNDPSMREKISKAMKLRMASPETKAKLSIACREGQLKAMAEGRHKPWQLRTKDTASYPEVYWMAILDAWGVAYDHNFLVVRNDEVRRCNYYLDFRIVTPQGIFDLEIDGKQHGYPENVQKDALRDAFLTAEGYTVLRLPWHNPQKHQVLLQGQVQELRKILESSGLQLNPA